MTKSPRFAFIVVLLLIAACVLFSDRYKVNSTKMPQQDSQLIEDSGKTYQEYRHLPSHFSTNQNEQDSVQAQGEMEERDKFDSAMHRSMKTLGELLGKPGTPADQVFGAMGDPDEVTRDLANPFQTPSFMPGPVVPEGASAVEGSEKPNTVYLVYYWRGRHDFLYFEMDEPSETIRKSDWFQALE